MRVYRSMPLKYLCDGGLSEAVHKQFRDVYGRDFDEFNPTEQDERDYEAIHGGTIKEAMEDYYKVRKLGWMTPTRIHKLGDKMDYDVWYTFKWKQGY